MCGCECVGVCVQVRGCLQTGIEGEPNGWKGGSKWPDGVNIYERKKIHEKEEEKSNSLARLNTFNIIQKTRMLIIYSNYILFFISLLNTKNK